MRELVEEFEPPQHAKLLLAVDARVLVAQCLMHAGKLGGKIKAALTALGRILLQRERDDALELLRNVLAQRMQGRRRRVHDLVQKLLQVAGTKRPRAA